MSRLDSSAPSLAQRLRSVDEPTQRTAATAAAAWAAVAAELDQAAVTTAVELLQRSEHLRIQQGELVTLVEELDGAAWSLRESEDDGISSQEAYVAAFGRARAVAAVLFAADPDSEVAALEATYEASVVAGDSSTLVAHVQAALDMV